MEWQKHIHADPNILIGKPVIKGTRISVELILELYESGWSRASILESYPTLKNEDLDAVFAYVKECIGAERYISIVQKSA